MMSNITISWRRLLPSFAPLRPYYRIGSVRSVTHYFSEPFGNRQIPHQPRLLLTTAAGSLDPQRPRFVQPHIYNSHSATWVPCVNRSASAVERGSIIKVVSWNIYMKAPDPARVSATLTYLRSRFGNIPCRQVIMFQEVRLESLQAILDDPWVQTNFVVSNVCPPDSLYTGFSSESFVTKRLDWTAVYYFTLMLVSKDMDILDCFRVPFITRMGRDALALDIRVCSPGLQAQALQPEQQQLPHSVRLCTTHLESLWENKRLALRPGQLASLSAVLKDTPSPKSNSIGGLVGGDMNAIEDTEHEWHKQPGVDLRDVWEDVPAPPIPKRKGGQRDYTNGRARGATWGCHTHGSRRFRRFDKFFYAGLVEAVALSETDDVTGKLGRLGIDLKTEVDAWEVEEKLVALKRGKYIEKTSSRFLSDKEIQWRLDRKKECVSKGMAWTRPDPVRKRSSIWVSDHFGIAVGIKVP